jgi:hypothetical protein
VVSSIPPANCVVLVFLVLVELCMIYLVFRFRTMKHLFVLLGIFAARAAADTMAVQCCEGTGKSTDTKEPLPPEPCGKNSSTWTMKAGATSYTTCAMGEACTQFTCPQKGCTPTSHSSCPRFRYHTCGSTVPQTIQDANCRSSTTTNGTLNAGFPVAGPSFPVVVCVIAGSMIFNIASDWL